MERARDPSEGTKETLMRDGSSGVISAVEPVEARMRPSYKPGRVRCHVIYAYNTAYLPSSPYSAVLASAEVDSRLSKYVRPA